MDSGVKYLVAVLAVVLVLLGVTTAQKSGSCPPPLNVAVCSYSCFDDTDCPTKEKCCSTSCGGTFCVPPVSARIGGLRVKPGNCPNTPTGPWVCSNRCSVDTDCRGNLKCCRNRCGAKACQKPEV